MEDAQPHKEAMARRPEADIHPQASARPQTHLQGLHGHSEAVLFPDALVHLPVLASTQLVLHGDVSALHFPLVVVGGHAVDGGLVALGSWVVECGDEPISHCRMMVNQLSQSVEAALRGDVQLRKTGNSPHSRSTTLGERIYTLFSVT